MMPSRPRQPPRPADTATTCNTLVHPRYASVACCTRSASLASAVMRVRSWMLLVALACGALLGAPVFAAPESLPGRILFVKDGDLWVWDVANGPHQLATGGTFSQPNWGPDGASLVYVY